MFRSKWSNRQHEPVREFDDCRFVGTVPVLGCDRLELDQAIVVDGGMLPGVLRQEIEPEPGKGQARNLLRRTVSRKVSA